MAGCSRFSITWYFQLKLACPPQKKAFAQSPMARECGGVTWRNICGLTSCLQEAQVHYYYGLFLAYILLQQHFL